MGRRSRKRADAPEAPSPAAPAVAPAHAPAAPRRPPATPRRRARTEERPPAPWGDVPLGELVTLAGIVLLVVGFAGGTYRLLALGFALVALSAIELSVREHFAGFRSHTSLLALVCGALVAAVLIAVGAPRSLQIALAAGALAAAFLALRRAFRRRAGGLGFRA
jgi:hypothetical protein